MKRTATLIIKLTQEERKIIKIAAIERNLTSSALVRQAIAIYLEKYCKNVY